MLDRKIKPGMNYEPPTLRVLGQLHALTLQDKMFGESDGFTMLGVPITNHSP